jgi:hypothetical protein
MKSLLFTPSMLSTIKTYPTLGHCILITVWFFYLSKHYGDSYESQERRWKDALDSIVDEVLGILPIFETLMLQEGEIDGEKELSKKKLHDRKEEESLRLLISMVDLLLRISESVPKEFDEEDSHSHKTSHGTRGHSANGINVTCGLCDDILQDECCCSSSNGNSAKSTSSNPVECCSWYTILQTYFGLTLSPSTSSSTVRSSDEHLPHYTKQQPTAQEIEEMEYHHMLSLFYQLQSLCQTMKEVAYGTSPLITSSTSSISKTTSTSKTAKGASSPSSVALYRMEDVANIPLSAIGLPSTPFTLDRL